MFINELEENILYIVKIVVSFYIVFSAITFLLGFSQMESTNKCQFINMGKVFPTYKLGCWIGESR